MKRKKAVIIGFTIACSVLIGCAKKGTTLTPTVTNNSSGSLNVSTQTLNFSSSSGSSDVIVEANTAWTANTNSSWIYVNPASGSNNGSFSVEVNSNSNSGSRGGTITVSAGGVTQGIAVTQAGAGAPPPTQYGDITVYFQHGFYGDPLEFYFNGVYEGDYDITTTYSTNPGCHASGTWSFDHLPYGSYGYSGILRNHDGSVNTTYSGTIYLNSDCVQKVVH